MEDVKNALMLVGNQDKWFDWIEYFGTYISGTRDIPDIQKKKVLQKVLDKILVSYDHVEKVHRLIIHFRIPVIVKNYTNIKRKPKKYLCEPSVSPANITDQLFDVENYSTVAAGSANIANLTGAVTQQKGYSVKLVAEMTAANLWSSPYSIYQQWLFDTIKKLHEVDGLNFKQISDWLNDNGYATPRGKRFQEPHTWSIYTKKVKSIQRFARQYDHKIKDMGVDVVDFVPTPP